jgi:hypothetical protein
VQGGHRSWLAALPESLHDSPTAQALQAIVEIGLDEWPLLSHRAAMDATEPTTST